VAQHDHLGDLAGLVLILQPDFCGDVGVEGVKHLGHLRQRGAFFRVVGKHVDKLEEPLAVNVVHAILFCSVRIITDLNCSNTRRPST
jgi:hypothetical protein